MKEGERIKKYAMIRITITALCIILVILVVNASHFSVAIANSSLSQGTFNVIYQVIIPGENGGRPVSNLKVTLLIMGFDNNTHSIRILGKADVPDNPLLASNTVLNGYPGGATYEFPNVPAPPKDEEWYYILSTKRDGLDWGEADSPDGSIATCTIPLDVAYPIPSDVANGTLYGFVLLDDPNVSLQDKRTSGVSVTLYSCLPYDESEGVVNTGIVDIPNNPQVTMSGDNVGMYRFDGLKPGYYNVTIEKDGRVGHTVINFTNDEDNNNWIDNNIVLLPPVSPSQTEAPTPQAPAPTPTTSPSIRPSIEPTPTTQTSVNIPTATSQATATPARTNGFQTMLTIVSLTIACSILARMARNK